MRPEEAKQLRVGEKVYIQPDMLLPNIRAGIYEIQEISTTVQAGRTICRFRITDNDWCRPQHVGKIAREQQGR